MKYVVEIDTTSKVGEEAIAYLRTLKKVGKAVKIREVEEDADDNRPFTAEEMALPGGRIPTKAQLEAFLDEKDGKATKLETFRKQLLEELTARKK